MRALFILTRPRFAPLVLLLPFFGYAWAHWDRALPMQAPGTFSLVLLAWAALHAGTMWLNADLDRDEGEVLFGESVPVPPYTATAGWLALAACLPLGWAAGVLPGLAVTGCALLSVLYSHPSTVWKGHPWLGPFVNVAGYGLLSPLAGWAVVGVPPNPRTLVAWALFAIGMLGPFFAAQAFQGQEDAARGYRTAVVVHGPRRTLLFARIAMAICLWGGVSLALIGWVPRVCLVAIPMWWWVDRHFARWMQQPGGGDATWAGRFGLQVLFAAMVMVAVTLVDYVRASAANEPVAGLGTASGHPTDRPRLPPYQMRMWEHRHGLFVRGPTDGS